MVKVRLINKSRNYGDEEKSDDDKHISPLFPTIHLTNIIIHHLDPRVNTLVCFKISQKFNKKATFQQVAF